MKAEGGLQITRMDPWFKQSSRNPAKGSVSFVGRYDLGIEMVLTYTEALFLSGGPDGWRLWAVHDEQESRAGGPGPPSPGQQPVGARQLGRAAEVHDPRRGGQPGRDQRGEHRGPGQVHDPAHGEQRGDGARRPGPRTVRAARSAGHT